MINTYNEQKVKKNKNSQKKEKVIEKNEMQIEMNNKNEDNSDSEKEEENTDSGLSVVGGFLADNFAENNKGTVEKINKLSWMKNQSTEIVTNIPENNNLNILENESNILKNTDEEVNFETNNTKNFFDSSSDDDEIPDIIDQPPDSD
ncbi:hypothetical protein M0812_08152 [Anaeramoeba flamelloides]|uniref:Uncharacterized protein n=1 Tax=Anaeramoeba flamelloides TaxID=1746091 RepID=A0AAV8A1A8_9EUKA|nr:hypothetical protein M0812_08152 [Anaeramoeba flamelloides]